MGPQSDTHTRLLGIYQRCPPPLFHTISGVGRGLSSVPEMNLPKEACHRFFYIYKKRYVYSTLIYTDLLIPGVTGGSAKIPPLDPNGLGLPPGPHCLDPLSPVDS